MFKIILIYNSWLETLGFKDKNLLPKLLTCIFEEWSSGILRNSGQYCMMMNLNIFGIRSWLAQTLKIAPTIINFEKYRKINDNYARLKTM